MALKNTLISIVLTGAMLFGGSGCDKKEKFTINGEKLEYRKSYVADVWNTGADEITKTRLTVEKQDGTVIEYIDGAFGDSKVDSKIDFVWIEPGDENKRYWYGRENAQFMKEAQKKFDNYTVRMDEIRVERNTEKGEQGLDYLN